MSLSLAALPLAAGAGRGKQALGGLLALLGVLVLSGFDKRLEALGVAWVPQWVLTL